MVGILGPCRGLVALGGGGLKVFPVNIGDGFVYCWQVLLRLLILQLPGEYMDL